MPKVESFNLGGGIVLLRTLERKNPQKTNTDTVNVPLTTPDHVYCIRPFPLNLKGGRCKETLSIVFHSLFDNSCDPIVSFFFWSCIPLFVEENFLRVRWMECCLQPWIVVGTLVRRVDVRPFSF